MAVLHQTHLTRSLLLLILECPSKNIPSSNVFFCLMLYLIPLVGVNQFSHSTWPRGNTPLLSFTECCKGPHLRPRPTEQEDRSSAPRELTSWKAPSSMGTGDSEHYQQFRCCQKGKGRYWQKPTSSQRAQRCPLAVLSSEPSPEGQTGHRTHGNRTRASQEMRKAQRKHVARKLLLRWHKQQLSRATEGEIVIN